MESVLKKVNIMMFKKIPCDPCEKVEPILRQIIKSSRDSATLTLIDSDEEKDLAIKFNIGNVPVVYFNDKMVLTGQQASELIIIDPFSKEDNDTDINFGSNSANSGLFNYLFNELITASVESNAEALERKQKFKQLIPYRGNICTK